MSLCVCAGKAGLAGVRVLQRGVGVQLPQGPAPETWGRLQQVEVTSPLRVRVGKTANLTSLGRF